MVNKFPSESKFRRNPVGEGSLVQKLNIYNERYKSHCLRVLWMVFLALPLNLSYSRHLLSSVNVSGRLDQWEYVTDPIVKTPNIRLSKMDSLKLWTSLELGRWLRGT